MDEIVRQAMARWPNVPHCFGWLRLDARGQWRMRDERAQQLALPGDPIRHPALPAFIDRNYACDDTGRWYFQNGPQRVYVDLEWVPHILRTQPGANALVPSLILHTQVAVAHLDAAWMDENGRLYLRSGNIIAGVDDRDLATLLPCLHHAGQADEEALLRWLEGAEDLTLSFTWNGQGLPLQRIASDQLEQTFSFVCSPRPA